MSQQDCTNRAKTPLGSSKSWPPTTELGQVPPACFSQLYSSSLFATAVSVHRSSMESSALQRASRVCEILHRRSVHWRRVFTQQQHLRAVFQRPSRRGGRDPGAAASGTVFSKSCCLVRRFCWRNRYATAPFLHCIFVTSPGQQALLPPQTSSPLFCLIPNLSPRPLAVSTSRLPFTPDPTTCQCTSIFLLLLGRTFAACGNASYPPPALPTIPPPPPPAPWPTTLSTTPPCLRS